MSREVEVSNIRMTATTPEDIQISLGRLAKAATPATAEDSESGVSLGASTGVLYAESGKTADNGGVTKPEKMWDWSNSADISAYYDIGRLMPASSNDGTEIFFTPDASGVGKTVKGNANYIKATNKLEKVDDSGTGTNKTYEATLHALTGERADEADAGKDAWAKTTYAQAAKYDVTNDDGYYVDIPIWLRTSSNAAVNLSVDGYVIPGSVADETNGDTQTQLELYRAVRVALLDGEAVTDTSNGGVTCEAGEAAVTTGSNILPLKDAWSTDGTTLVSATKATEDTEKYTADKLKASNTPFASGNPSILDSINLNEKFNATTTRYTNLGLTGDFSKTAANGGSLAGVKELGTQGTATDNTTYTPGKYEVYTAIKPSTDATPDTVATIAGSGTNAQYGAEKKLIIRVWLDGEDGECWNDNAGQDWSICLKFAKIEASGS